MNSIIIDSKESETEVLAINSMAYQYKIIEKSDNEPVG